MKNNWLKLIVFSTFAGICIGFAAALYLYALTFSAPMVEGVAVKTPSLWEKTLSAALFGFGLFFIIAMEYNLFTGMVAGLADMPPRDYIRLVVCYAMNAVGVLVVCLLVLGMNNSVSKAVIERAAITIEGKLANTLLGAFFSSVMCGMMITFAVKSHARAKDKGLSATLGVIFPVLLFSFMGFEHCVANQAYIFLGLFGKADIDLWRLLAFALITAGGNIVGGIFFPILTKSVSPKIETKAVVEPEEKDEREEKAA